MVAMALSSLIWARPRSAMIWRGSPPCLTIPAKTSLAAGPVISAPSTVAIRAAGPGPVKGVSPDRPVAEFAGQLVDDPAGDDLRRGAAGNGLLEEVTGRPVT